MKQELREPLAGQAQEILEIMTKIFKHRNAAQITTIIWNLEEAAQIAKNRINENKNPFKPE